MFSICCDRDRDCAALDSADGGCDSEHDVERVSARMTIRDSAADDSPGLNHS